MKKEQALRYLGLVEKIFSKDRTMIDPDTSVLTRLGSDVYSFMLYAEELIYGYRDDIDQFMELAERRIQIDRYSCTISEIVARYFNV